VLQDEIHGTVNGELSINGAISAWACFYIFSSFGSGAMLNGTCVSSVCNALLMYVRVPGDLPFSGNINVRGCSCMFSSLSSGTMFNGNISSCDVSCVTVGSAVFDGLRCYAVMSPRGVPRA
jgi:hypothetical protein